MAANNETGVLFSLREAAESAHARGALLFTDAAQAPGRIPLDVCAEGADLAAFSAHKVHGPKGVGALFVRGGPDGPIALEPQFAGGGQEGGLRAGTENVPGIVGFGEACRIAREALAADAARMAALRDRLESALAERIPGLRILGDREARLPNTSNLLFPGAEARAFIRALHDVAVSTRSACSSGSGEASHVLLAMGLSPEEAHSCIRFSLGRFSTREEIDAVVDKVAASYRKLAGMEGT
jgi:cysteine desulfurase